MAGGGVAGLFGLFERVRIVSLPSRTDRRRALAGELNAAGVPVDGTHVAFHDAVRPDDAGGFPTIGTRGCFLSHLAVLRDARDVGAASVLLLEDDVTFAGVDPGRLERLAAVLGAERWNIFYGGVDGLADRPGDGPLRLIDPADRFTLAHCVAFDRAALSAAVPYLEAILTRPPGSAEGGPMHVDGAYGWLRAARPELRTLLAAPAVAFQRASRTDIHALRLWDRLPVVRSAVNALRALR